MEAFLAMTLVQKIFVVIVILGIVATLFGGGKGNQTDVQQTTKPVQPEQLQNDVQQTVQSAQQTGQDT